MSINLFASTHCYACEKVLKYDEVIRISTPRVSYVNKTDIHGNKLSPYFEFCLRCSKKANKFQKLDELSEEAKKLKGIEDERTIFLNESNTDSEIDEETFYLNINNQKKDNDSE